MAEVPNSTAIDPLFVSIVMHAEEDVSRGGGKSNIPDYDGDSQVLKHYTTALREFGQMAARHGAKINLGADWTFSRGLKNFDAGFYAEWEAMGHEVDPHAHETGHMYDSVRDDITAAEGHPTQVASGVGEFKVQDRMRTFSSQDNWFKILWGVSQIGHGVGEVTAGWVWRPSLNDWLTHDPNGRFIYVGSGTMVNEVADVRLAVNARRPDCVNTYAFFVPVRSFKANPGTISDSQFTAAEGTSSNWKTLLKTWDDLLTTVDSQFVSTGQVKYASLTDIAQVFEAHEGQLRIPGKEQIPRAQKAYQERKRPQGTRRP